MRTRRRPYWETADTQPGPLPGIAARHSSYCARCDVLIVPGDRIAFTRGRPIHVACTSGQDEEVRHG